MARRDVRMAHAAAIVGYIDGQPNRYRTLREENIKAMMAPPARQARLRQRRFDTGAPGARAVARFPHRSCRPKRSAFSCA
jgi:hypothetical protein